jgi:hypothetical protein
MAALQTGESETSAVEIYRLAPLMLLTRCELPDEMGSMIWSCGVAFAPDDSGLVVVGKNRTLWVPMSCAP